MAADDPEAYQNWVRNAEKQRIQVCRWFAERNWSSQLIILKYINYIVPDLQ